MIRELVLPEVIELSSMDKYLIDIGVKKIEENDEGARPDCVPADWRYLGDGQWASPEDAWGFCDIIHPTGTEPKCPRGDRHLVINAGHYKIGDKDVRIALDARTNKPIDWEAYSLQWYGMTEAQREKQFLEMTEDPRYAQLYRSNKGKSFAAFMNSRRVKIDDEE